MPHELNRISFNEIGLIKPKSAVEKLAEFQAVAERQAQESVNASPVYASVISQVGESQWVHSHNPAVRVKRRPDWRVHLQELIRQWTDHRYAAAKRSCFMFACASIDAMCGTDAEATMYGNWRCVGDFWPYLQRFGGREYFDRVGRRAFISQARTGDLLQFEQHNAGNACLHWAVVTDDYGKAISFEVNGLTEVDIGMAQKAMAVTRCWHIG